MEATAREEDLRIDAFWPVSSFLKLAGLFLDNAMLQADDDALETVRGPEYL